MDILTIILFFIYTWGIGFTATSFFSLGKDKLEQFFLQIAIGLGVLPILLVLLNFVRIPLDWKILLALSIIYPLYKLGAYLKRGNPSIALPTTLTKSNIRMIVVLLIFAASLYMYLTGAFSYPYLENEDPWGHSVGVKYVAVEKTGYDPDVTRLDRTIDPVLSYIDPYPPAYDIFLGILHQTSPDINWTMKFFNALIISLGLIFFYLFAKKFIGNGNKALLATFILAAVPSYLSHFIWAHSLVVTIFFPTMFALLMTVTDKKWTYLSIILIASIWVTQNLSQPIKLSTMILLFLVIYSVTSKKVFTRGFAALFGGIALSFVWWGAMIKKYTYQGFLSYYVGGVVTGYEEAITASATDASSLLSKIASIIIKVTKAGGSGSRVYRFDDFFYATNHNLINNPIGIGIVISLLVFVGLIYVLWRYKSTITQRKQTWLAVTLFWLIFTFWGVMGQAFPISVAKAPFRIWMLLAIPVSLIAVEGFYFLRGISTNRSFRLVVSALLIVGILFTSAAQKYEHNTTIWPTSGSFAGNEAFAYGEWFNTIPRNTPVFLYSPRDKLTIGLGGYSCAWCQDVIDFRAEFILKNADELYQFLKQHEYKYLLINGRMDTRYAGIYFGENGSQHVVQQRYNEIIAHPGLQPVYQKDSLFFVFEVV